MNHPATSGVNIEAPASDFANWDPAINSRVAIAQYVRDIGKPLYIMSFCPAGEADSYVDDTAVMAQKLKDTLGIDFFCSDSLYVMPAAYPVQENNMPFLPERLGTGEIAPTYMGAVLKLSEIKSQICGGNGSQIVEQSHTYPDLIPPMHHP
jgi:hypothetical protein